MLQVLTTTGCRPLAFAICARWMARQTYAGPVRWIVVDDGEEPTNIPELPEGWTVDVVRPEPFWQPGDLTQPRNLVAGLRVAETLDAPVVIVEDDDYYPADYLEVMARRLLAHELVGSGPQRWCNVRLQTWGEYSASWPWTSGMAFRPSVIPHMIAIASTRAAYIDRDGWKLWTGDKAYFADGRLVGIKGLPGRPGYMPCHHRRQGNNDLGLRRLRRWIGNDVEVYLR